MSNRGLLEHRPIAPLFDNQTENSVPRTDNAHKGVITHLPLWLATLILCFAIFSDSRAENQAAVASAHPLATAAGHEILAAGGNAFDAAVAVSATLAVVEPYSSGMGGGGFWLLHHAADQRDIVVDGRERAPLAAHRDLYLDSSGGVIPRLSIDGALAAAIPGQPAALVHISQRYGRLPLATALAPAIRHARQGFPVTPHYRRLAELRLSPLLESPAATDTFLTGDKPPPEGHLIKQPELATTLEAIARHGHNGFYQGTVANNLVKGVRAAGGIWTERDLQEYRVIERRPLTGSYQGYRITSVPPPSSGGIAILTILNTLSQLPFAGSDRVTRTHLIIEAMRRAYRDRAIYLGDSDYVSVPVERLTHPYYAAGLAATIHPQRASKSADLPGVAAREGGNDTSHLSILDSSGNYVAATLSINYPFGSGFMPKETGILLNDEMDDFSSKPGSPNVYGLVGGTANAIEGGKRMLSSMSPTFVSNSDRVAILGTPGGSRIITMVLLAILDFVEGGEPEDWVSLPRFHQQYLPDKTFFEANTLTPSLQDGLQQRGHPLEVGEGTWGNMQAILWDRSKNRVAAASDPRVEGSAQIR